MLFNLSNHPCHAEKSTWSQEQIADAARLFGEGIIDCGFPACTPDMSDEQLRGIAHEVARDLKGQSAGKPAAAMVAGHYILVTYIVAALQEAGIPCYVGDSIRVAEEQVQPDGSIAIVHKFQFAGFRAYPAIALKEV